MGNLELYSVIKNDKPTDELVWKFWGEDFNNNSQLIVMESEEALFVKDGVIVETFTGGKYTLNTSNYPVIGRLRRFISGGESAFNCKVYFIDKTHKLELFWGTDSPIQIRDAEFGFMVQVSARGSYSVQIKDSKKFFNKLVGNVQTFSTLEINTYFRTVFQTKMKTKLATIMKEQNKTILDMNTELEKIAEEMTPEFENVLDEYGIRLVNLYISDISIPETDPNYALINDAYAQKGILKVQGETWGKLSAKELLKDLANNPGAGGVAAAGAGMGMGMAAGGVFGNLANQMFEPMQKQVQNDSNVAQTPTTSRFAPKSQTEKKDEDTMKCPNCGTTISKNTKFCSECGIKIENKEIFCKNCGNKMSTTSKFCENCGTRREE